MRNRRSSAFTFATMLPLALLLAGCAAGSPATVAPTAAPDDRLAAVQATAAPPTEPPAPPTTTPEPTPTTAPAPPTQPPAETVAPAPADSAAPASDETPAALEAFTSAPTAASDVAAAADPALAQVAPAARPPAPPAPGDGTILNYYRGPSDRLEVALTFDAGADRGYAAQILDLLRDEGIHATFGMTGAWAEQNPDLIQRMVAEGHQLINHTWSHGSLTGASTGKDPITYDKLLDELTSTEAVIRDLTGYELKPYFRPPYGDIGPITSGYLAQAGYYVDVLWSCDSWGWNGFTAGQVFERCTSEEMGGPGAILLFHVGAGAAGDYESLPDLIAHYREQGYSFVTIEQMLQP